MTDARSWRERRAATLRRWLRPGIGIKRWLLVVFLGMFAIALAGSLALRALSQSVEPAEGLVAVATLQFLPIPVRVLIGLAVGAGLFLFGLWRLVDALLEPFVRDEPLVELIYQKRSLARGPRVVALGGGTGLSALLRGLKEHTSNLTAIVAMADDGGSSGKLRDELGIPPVGDIRKSIAALADAEPLMTQLLGYRFPAAGPDGLPGGLAGHSVGNLLIAALTDLEGDFEEGVRQSNRVLAVRGEVVPAAAVPLTLHAELADGSVLDGQSVIGRASAISRVWVTPGDVRASSQAVRAIAQAELIVVGPGSLYTSLLPSLLIGDLRDAIAASPALRIFVCNVATQVGETEGYAVSDHLGALDRHGILGLFDVVLVNDDLDARQPANYPAAPVVVDVPLQPAAAVASTVARRERPIVVARSVVDPVNAHRHDPARLAAAVLQIHAEHVVRLAPPVARSA